MGFIDGDGCFTVNFLGDNKLWFGFHITGHTSARELLEKVKHKLNCGVVKVKNKGTLRYQVDSINAIRDQIIPFVYKYKLFTNKAIHYSRFKQVVNLVKSERAYEIEWLPEAGVYAAHATLGCHTSPPKGVGGG